MKRAHPESILREMQQQTTGVAKLEGEQQEALESERILAKKDTLEEAVLEKKGREEVNKTKRDEPSLKKLTDDLWGEGRSSALASSEFFLPLLFELFVALFKAQCFSSLVLRVLQAVEDEIVVDSAFRPYLLPDDPDDTNEAPLSSTHCAAARLPYYASNPFSYFSSPVSPASACANTKWPNSAVYQHGEEEIGSKKPQRALTSSSMVMELRQPGPLFRPPVFACGCSLRTRVVVDGAAAGTSTAIPNTGLPAGGLPEDCCRAIDTATELSVCKTAQGIQSSSSTTNGLDNGNEEWAASAFQRRCSRYERTLPAGLSTRRSSAAAVNSTIKSSQGHDTHMPFFTKLELRKAFERIDARLGLTRRKIVPPSFHECRMLVNLAQMLASKEQLRLITFDGDETLYPNGANFEDVRIAQKIAAFLKRGTHVAVVTAAGYGYDVEKYHERLGFLLEFLKQQEIDAKTLGNFYVMGGESNYLMRLSEAGRLERVPEEYWMIYRPRPCPAEAQQLLDLAEKTLRKFSQIFCLPATIIRKDRGVGLVRRNPQPGYCGEGFFENLSNSGMHRESLEEIVMRVRRVLHDELVPQIPWSAFCGGKDVWVDVGNKAEGVAMLQGMLRVSPCESLHVGDQFGASGNDMAARVCSPTVWISNPEETAAVLHELLDD